MSNSKFGQPKTVQQPPPVCKKGPPKVAIDEAWPPSNLSAAVSYQPDGITYYPYALARVIHLQATGVPATWYGEAIDNDFQTKLEMTFNPAFQVWSASLDITFPNGLADQVDVYDAFLRTKDPFETFLEARTALSGMGTGRIKVLT